MNLRIVLLGISLFIAPPGVSAESRPDLFLQCRLPVRHHVPSDLQSETLSSLCREIPSIHWERCANHTLTKLSNDDSSWNNRPLSVTIAKDAKPNAFLTNQQQIIITSGLISLISTSEQLAFVIAHELAHAMIDSCAQIDRDPQMNRHCKHLSPKNPYPKQSRATDALSHEIEADHVALMIMSANNLFISHPTSLLEDIAKYQAQFGNAGIPEISARIASLESTQ